MKIPFHQPDVGKEEANEVAKVIQSGWLTTGPKTRLFEERFARFVGAKHAVALTSCTAAMELSLTAYGVGEGDEVITTPFTFPATAEVIIQRGARPVFVDIKPDTLCLDENKIEEAITRRTKAVLPVHYAGLACEMKPILAIAKKYQLKVIEDAAHAFPTVYQKQRVGSIGDATCFSFYVTKTITTGEGGMFTTNDVKTAERVRRLSLHGLSKDIWERRKNKGHWAYDVIEPGRKYNLSDLQSALGVVQLAKAETMRNKRKNIAAQYDKAFKSCESIELPFRRSPDEHAWHLYVIQIQPETLRISRDQIIEKLAQEGIGTSVHFIPMHLHSYYRKRFGFKPHDFPAAYAAFKRVISLPIYPGLTPGKVNRVSEILTRIIKKDRR